MHLKKVNHRVHREIIMLKKKKTLSTQRKKINKNSVISVVKYFGAELCGLCGLFS